uniref:Uncharacterized protein n=1 Tax=Panagrolaimus superbus TaxID=310955 RepID=A0A914YA57_9BILA
MDYSPSNRGGHTGGQRLYPLGPTRGRRDHEAAAPTARDRRYDERDDGGDEVQDLRNPHRSQYRNNDRNENDNRGDGRERGVASGRGGRSGGPNHQRDVHSYQVEDERQQPVQRQPNREDFYDGRHQLERNDRLNHRENDNNYQFSPERRGPPPRDEQEYEADHPRARPPPNNQRRQQRVHQQDERIYEDPQLLHEQNYDHPPLDDYREGRLQDRNAFYAERLQARIRHSSDLDRDHSNRNPPNGRVRARVHYEDDEGTDYGYPPTAHENPPRNHQQFVRENSNYPPQMDNRQGIPQREYHPRAPPPPPPPPPQQQRDEQNLNESVYDNVPVQDERSRHPPMDPFQNSLPRNERNDAIRRPSEDPIRVQQQSNRQPIHQGKYGPALRSQQEEYEHEQQRLQQHPQPRPQHQQPQHQQPQHQQPQHQQPRRPSVYQHPPETFYDNFPRREEPIQQRLHQRSQQSPAVIHENENVYNEIPNHSNQEEFDHSRGRPPPDDQRRQQRVHQQVDTDYEDAPLNSAEQNYDHPPTSADHRRQNRSQERNRVYEEPPSNHNQYHRQNFSIRVQCGSAATSPQPEHVQGREEETLPESQQWNVRRIAAPQQPEHVPVEVEETSPPTTLLPAPEQWNIRRIVPRQTRDQRNGNNNINGIINQEDQSFVEIVDDNIGRGATNEPHPIIDANEGWDTPIPGPEEVAPLSSFSQEAPVAPSQSNHFSGRGGGQGGFNYPLQHHRYQSSHNQNNNNNNNNNNNLQSFDATNDEHQQQPQRPPRNDEDFFGGFEDGFAPPHRSYRPPTFGEQGGRQGYGGQNGYSGYQPQNFRKSSFYLFKTKHESFCLFWRPDL